MKCRKDATALAIGLLAFGVGCTTTAKREPSPPADSRPSGAAPIQPVTYQEKVQTPSQADPDPLNRLHREATQACAQHSSYICRLRRREFANGKQKPEELMIFKCRSRPFSVHFKWLGNEGKGREVTYVAGQSDDALHILTAAGDIPLTPAGRRLDLPRDSLLVKAASRYPITEAGVCAIITRFRRHLDEFQRGRPGLAIQHVGPMQRPEYPVALEAIEFVFPPNYEPEIPLGGKRLLCFDPATKWPVLSATIDVNGREIDYHCFDRFQLNVNLDDDDFNPAKLWPPKGS